MSTRQNKNTCESCSFEEVPYTIKNMWMNADIFKIYFGVSEELEFKRIMFWEYIFRIYARGVGAEALELSGAVANCFSLLVITLAVAFVGLIAAVVNHQNFLYAMFSVEVLLLGTIISFALYAITLSFDWACIRYALMVIIIAACESALGLGILVAIFRSEKTIDYSKSSIIGG